MAAPASRGRANPGGKGSPAARRAPAHSQPTGPKLLIRYYKRMKPTRAYPLSVTVPALGKKADTEEFGKGPVVVVRPVIAGAQVTPAEQRLEINPGNQISFIVTPIARGKLPRARLEVFSPGQPPEAIPTPMKAKTQRLAILLLLLAFLVPIGITRWTIGDWAPRSDPRDANVQSDAFKKTITDTTPPIPIIGSSVKWLDDLLGIDHFTLSSSLADRAYQGYQVLQDEVREHPWFPNALACVFIFLAILSWIFHDPSRAKKTYTMQNDPGAGVEPGEPIELEPI